MATDKQIAADRRNALKSAGPRTPRGQAFTRLDVLRHGLCTVAGIPPGASLEELDLIHSRLVNWCQPQTAKQVRLVEQMAIARWLWLNWRRQWQATQTQILGEAAGTCAAGRVALLDKFSRRQARYGHAFIKACMEYERSTRLLPSRVR